MNPALVITIIEAAIKLVPLAQKEIALLLQKTDPSPEDWEALRVHVSKTYEDYIAEAGGRPTGPTPP
jgi:hypothetical protein